MFLVVRRAAVDVPWTQGRDVWWHDVVDSSITQDTTPRSSTPSIRCSCCTPRAPALGRIHARQIVTVHVAAEIMTIDLGGDEAPDSAPDHHPAGPQHQSPAAPQSRPRFLGNLESMSWD